jgi:hypothetical protein
MRAIRLLPCLLLLLVPLVLSGCRKVVSFEKSVTVVGGEAYQEFTIDPPPRDQKVDVTVSSATAPVNVYVVLEKDLAAVQDSLRLEKSPANVLEKRERVQDASLEVTVPARSSFTVLLTPVGGKTAQLNLKIKSR